LAKKLYLSRSIELCWIMGRHKGTS